jgi:phosphoribosylanthranilate isomerase
MSVIIKICGLSAPEPLEAALNAGADLVGFVFVRQSPRHVGFDTARQLARQTGRRAKKVALLVDPDEPTAAGVMEALEPDLVQLHGQESPARVGALRRHLNVPLIKAIGVATADDLAAVRAFIGVADHILIDAKAPAKALYPGGHGAPFDWSILSALDPRPAFILSGGLNPENVADALIRVRPWGVDVSSGVEKAPGQKDPEKIATFIARVRQAAQVQQSMVAHIDGGGSRSRGNP